MNDGVPSASTSQSSLSPPPPPPPLSSSSSSSSSSLSSLSPLPSPSSLSLFFARCGSSVRLANVVDEADVVNVDDVVSVSVDDDVDANVVVAQPRPPRANYVERFIDSVRLIDPRLLLVTAADLDRDRALLADAATAPDAERRARDTDVVAARRRLDQVVHPDTGEPIPVPFRFSSFVPFNVFLTAMMIQPNPAPAVAMFWQWFNQSYNVGINYCNSNHSDAAAAAATATTTDDSGNDNNADADAAAAAAPTSTVHSLYERLPPGLMSGYAVATALSMTLAFAGGLLSQRAASMGARARAVLAIATPYVSVTSASCANALVTRRSEWSTGGVHVEDAEHRTLDGTSRLAGVIGMRQVCTTRALWSVPALLLPATLMGSYRRTRTHARHPRFEPLVNLTVITATLALGVPAAIAVYPQRAEIDVRLLEPEFQQRLDPLGRRIDYVYFNKGI